MIKNVDRPTRRDIVLGVLGGAAAAALSSACGGSTQTASGANSGGGAGSAGTGGSAGTAGAASGGGAGASGTGGSAGASNACTLYPAETEGPFYVAGEAVRQDITEGKPGTPLRVEITVQRASTCAPLPGVAVDIWHCDASGVYSGYPGQLGGLDTTGMTFLRGTQITDADGKVAFDTIYPGWYPGRTTHIHFKIHPTATSDATSQMYFDEAVTGAMYQAAPYAAHGPKDTTNAGDGVVAGNLPPLALVSKHALGVMATLTVNVAG